MSKITTIVDSIISKVNEHTNNVASLEAINNNHIPLSGITSYHLLQGNLAVSNSTITKGFDTKLYTSGSVTTGIDMSTQWGSTADEKYGGLIWLKDRVEATNNFLYDTIRGATKEINSNTTDAEATLAGGLTAFNSTGFTVGADTGHNSTTNNMASWNFQTTHRITGTTNHGKAYTCHYNPFTGFTIVKYEGSGIAGHEIPHHLGRKLGFVTVKNLSAVADWLAQREGANLSLNLNATTAEANVSRISSFGESSVTISAVDTMTNTNTNQYIMYGWANSYFDESGKLIGNYELVTYQGTGAAGNKVTTRGKPAWIKIKRVDSADNWAIFDNARNTFDAFLLPNLSTTEYTPYDRLDANTDGFTLKSNDSTSNASGGQYIALVAYDTNSNGGGSYYPLASDTANVQVNNALIPLAKGIDGNGVKNSIVVANETITGVTYTAGKNYLYKTDSGYGVKNIAPNYGKINPANGGDFYNVITNKWFTSAGVEIVESRNYMNHIVHADNDGGVLYVEELPKIEYKDIVKANEFKGKNACTFYANIDMTTTPPTVRESYNLSTVIRTGTGLLDIYFEDEMDYKSYSIAHSLNDRLMLRDEGGASRQLNKVSLIVETTGGVLTNADNLSVQIFGGKN